MDNIIEKSRRNVYTKTRCPIDMDLDFFLAKALKNSCQIRRECWTVLWKKVSYSVVFFNLCDRTCICFVIVSVTPSYPLPKRESGYKIFKNGVISKICVNKEPHGVFWQNDGHFGSYEKVSLITEECDPCNWYGPQMKTICDTWSMAPMRPMLATCPCYSLSWYHDLPVLAHILNRKFLINYVRMER